MRAVDPSVDEQFDRMFEFADAVHGGSSGAGWQAPEKQLVYYTVGENVWKTTTVWPPAGHMFRRMWFNSGFRLTS